MLQCAFRCLHVSLESQGLTFDYRKGKEKSKEVTQGKGNTLAADLAQTHPLLGDEAGVKVREEGKNRND